MNILVTIFLAVLSLNCLAQTEPSFSFADFEESISKLNNPNSTYPTNQISCEANQKASPAMKVFTHCDCEIPPGLGKKQFKEKSGEFELDKLPPKIKEAVARFSNLELLNPRGRWYTIIETENDLNMPPAGLVAYMFRPKVEFSNLDFDQAYTHGLQAKVGKVTEKGFNFYLKGETRLFTQDHPDYEPGTDNILFTEENIWSAGFDNTYANGPLKYGVEVGVNTLKSDKKSTYLASGQQDLFHAITSQISSTEQARYNYIPDGTGVVRNPFMTLSIGLANSLWRGGRCELRMGNSIGQTLTPNPDLNLTTLLNQLKFDINGPRSRLSIETGVETIRHSQGIQVSPLFAITYATKWGGLKSQWKAVEGTQVNYQKYNYIKHDISSIAIYYYLSKPKKKRRRRKRKMKKN